MDERDALVEKLRRYSGIENDYGFADEAAVMARAADAIAALRARAEQAAAGWIPVSEQLPERSQHVLISWHPKQGMAVAKFGGKRWIDVVGSWRDDFVTPTYWRPLPEPPAIDRDRSQGEGTTE